MTKFRSCFRVCGIVVFLTAFSFQLLSQVVYNNGLDIYAKEGAIFFVDGTVQNEAGLIEVEENVGNNAQLIIQQDFLNNATAGGNGYYRVLGNWINNSVFNAGTGTVFLEGANQLLDGSVSTYFNNLTLDGSGLKTQTIDQYCTGILDLKHLELQNEVFGFYVTNTDVGAIIRTTGFVSALDGGFLSRQTNSVSMYLYPVGSSVGVTRYRPVELTPSDASANTYTVRMANVLATTEGYDVNALPPKICEVNPEFYHQINQTVGTASVDLDVFYNETEDGEWDGLAKWTTSPDLWERIMTTVITPGAPFNEALVASWNDFVEIPYILYRYLPDPTITNPGAFCEYDLSQNLVAADPGGTWTGTGITDAVNGTFDPATAGPGLHAITYEVGSGTCVNTDQIDITVNATPDATITDPGDFCNTDSPLNLTAATGGGTWSGTGITDALNGTFDPSVANIGSNSITYDLTLAGCTSSDMISIDVFTTPDATITAPGAFCDNDASVNLTAATAGGTWSGTGITDALNGTFDPSTAGAGLHTITYDVGTGSCTDTDQIDITVNATPDATITDPGDFCNTDASLNLTAATGGGTWSGTGITDALNGTFDPSVASVGPNSITYDITVAGCTSSGIISIDVYDTPDATIADPGTFCTSDASMDLTAATGGGTWSGTGIIDASNGTFDPASAGSGVHTITYNVGIGSCAASDQIDLTVNLTPDASITNPGDFCNTDVSTTLLSATMGGTWTGTGIINATTGEFDPTSANIGANSISYEVTVSGCIGTDNIVITVYDTPDATITDPGAFCSNDMPFDLSAVSTGGTWSGTGITDALNGTFDPSTAGAGLHTVTYDVGTGSCTDSDQIDITVNATPDATITDPGDFCNTDATINLTAATAGGTWSGDGITDAVNGTFDPSVASVGTNTISYDITVLGCSSSDNITIDVYDAPDATITDPGAFCTTDIAIDLTAASAGGTWSGTGITDATNGTFDPVIAGEGTHTITYNVGTGSCAATDQIDLIVNLTPDASITNPGDFCNSDISINLTAATTGGTWTGTGIIDAVNGTFDPAVADIGANTITYEVSSNGCTSSDNIMISVFETPDATITYPGDLCSSDEAVNLSSVSSGGTWSGTGITDSENGIFDPSVAGSGTHTITYNVGTGLCADSDQIDIIVNEAPNVIITDPGSFCYSDPSVNLTGLPAGGIWSGTGIIDPNLGTFDPTTAGEGDFDITYSVTQDGCTGNDQITINVYSSPDVSIDPVGPFCFEANFVQLSAETEGGVWSGPGVDSDGIFNVVAAGVGLHEITYQFSGNCGATGTTEIVVVPGIVQANYTVHNPLCQGGLDGYIEFTVSGGTHPYSYSWGIDGYSETNIISGLTGGIYTVTITDSNGCSMDVDGIILEEGDEDCVFIPNAFTPNGDGVNDQWIISNLDSYDNYFIQVFNRWGQEIYTGVPGSDPWDGSWNGKIVPTGGYIYIVQIDEIAEEFVGVVMLVK